MTRPENLPETTSFPEQWWGAGIKVGVNGWTSTTLTSETRQVDFTSRVSAANRETASSMLWPKMGAVLALLALLMSVQLSLQAGDDQPSHLSNSEFIHFV